MVIGVGQICLTNARGKAAAGLLTILISTMILSGCVKKFSARATSPQEPEQILFKAVSEFYCSQRRWPRSFDELYARGQGVPQTSPETTVRSVRGYLPNDVANFFTQPILSSARPIVFSVEYLPTSVGEKLVRRKATFIAPPSCKDEGSQLRADGRISLAGGRLSFILSPAFTPLSSANIREKWGRGAAPDVAWSDAAAGVTLAVRFGEAPLTEETLEKFNAALEAAYSRSVPEIEWVQKEVSLASAPKLLKHEFTSASAQGKLRTIVFSLPFDGTLLSISVTAALERAAATVETATAIRDSLQVEK